MGYIIGTCIDLEDDSIDEDILKKHTHVFLNSCTFTNQGELIFPQGFYYPITTSNSVSGIAAKVFNIKKEYRGVKTILTIDASGNLNVFNKIISIEEFRTTLVESICTAVRNYGLDGINIIWQHPISGVKPEVFALFVKAVKARFKQTQILHRYDQLLLCLTINPRISSIEYYRLDLFDDCIDLFHLMGHDMSDNWMKRVSHYNISYHDIKQSIKYLFSIGTLQNKILIGIPFHGHVFEGTLGYDEIYNKSYIKTYKDISTTYDITKACYNEEYGVSFIYDFNEKIYVSFEDPISVKESVKYMKEEGLAGIITSNHKNDDDCKSLTKIIINAIGNEKDTSNNNIIYITSQFTNIVDI